MREGFMKLKMKPFEWAILVAVPTGICAACFVGENRAAQVLMGGLVSGFIVLSWEVSALQREVQRLRQSDPKRNV
jgi:hypothetical protein